MRIKPMIDGINAIYHIPDTASDIYTLPCWEVLVNEQTGKRVTDSKSFELRGLFFSLKPSINGGYVFRVQGSLHRWHNMGKDNAGQFTAANVLDAISGLCHVLDIPPEQMILHGLEIGVNIPLPFPVIRVLNNVVTYKGKDFSFINTRLKSEGIVTQLGEYRIKVYDKAAAVGKRSKDINLLRFEVKINRMRWLKDYGITTLADLTDTGKLYALKQVLQSTITTMIFTDTGANLNRMTDREQKSWLHLSNPKAWQGLNKNTLYKRRKRINELIEKYNLSDTGRDIESHFFSTWERLFENHFEAQNGRPFHRIKNQSEADKQATFSQLEYTGKKSPLTYQKISTSIAENYLYANNNMNIDSAKNTLNENKKKNSAKNAHRFCRTCGNDITHQRPQSKFCSRKYVGEKRAHQCRNMDSNRRRTLKQKIYRAMEQNKLLSITYTDQHGDTYTDILHPSEISGTLPREWLNRIQSVQVLDRDPQEHWQGKQARKQILLILKQYQNAKE